MSAALRLSSAFPQSERPRRFSAPVEDRLRQALARIPDLPQPFLCLRLNRIVRLARRLEAWADAEAERGPAAILQAGHALRHKRRSARHIARVLSLCRAVCQRTLRMRPYDVQLMGAAGLLEGRVVEMETGEGKTLSAALAAAAAALAGSPVHVVTVNDYLAERDAATLTPFFTAMGLSVGLVVHGLTPAERRAAYAAQIVYVTNKELTFDYLRDQLCRQSWPNEAARRLTQLAGTRTGADTTVLRGLHFAIIDEADSILIDEARTPLIISGSGEERFELETATQALAIAQALLEGEDFMFDRSARSIDLTQAGSARIGAAAQTLGRHWRNALSRADLVQKALSALYLFERDIHYLVADDKVQIIDEYTGRVMADRFWSDGLHQMVEVKEGLALSDSRTVFARITYQRFFARYWHLAGMSGTLRECERELREVYGLKIARIPTHRRSRRQFAPARVYATGNDKWQAVAAVSGELARQGRAVLIGTRTVATSQLASRHLQAAALEHVVLNAAQDADEADVIARAGEPGRITIATNMAGRGTDIGLPAEVVARGGLAVILTERHEAARIDRQLAGRCGRQGEPGTVHVLLSLEDALLDLFRSSRTGRMLVALARRRRRLALYLIGRAQRRSESIHHAVRRDLLRLEERLGRALAFSGPPE